MYHNDKNFPFTSYFCAKKLITQTEPDEFILWGLVMQKEWDEKLESLSTHSIPPIIFSADEESDFLPRKFSPLMPPPVRPQQPLPFSASEALYEIYPTSVEEIYDHVQEKLKSNSLIEPEIARRFLENLFRGGFTDIDPALQTGGISSLNLEAKLILYESVAQECYNPEDPDNLNNLKYLSALNAEMGLGEDFYLREAQKSTTFCSVENLRRLSQENPNLLSNLAKLFNNDPIRSEIKETIYQEMVDIFCDFFHMPRKEIYFQHEENKRSLGGYVHDHNCIFLNTNSDEFQKNSIGTLETLFHEARHGMQHDLADAYRTGKIQPNHPDYAAARIFYVNIKTIGGYINANANYAAYDDQPSERDARVVGQAVVTALQQNVGILNQCPKPSVCNVRTPEFAFSV